MFQLTPVSEGETLHVTQQRWRDAQEYERSDWVRKNRRNNLLTVAMKFVKAGLTNIPLFRRYFTFHDFFVGDDWNYWWLDAFLGYAALPRRFQRALEVGCGPYTNMRLVSQLCRIDEIYCSDPLIDIYASFKRTWLADRIAAGGIITNNDVCEHISYPDGHFNLLVSINVLDHVQDAVAGLREMTRVLAPGGYLVLGQDLTNEADLQRERTRHDVGHPIRIRHQTLDTILDRTYASDLRLILPRHAGRNPDAHYGTYLFIGHRLGE